MLFGGGNKHKLVALTELGRHKSEDLCGSHGIRLQIVSDLAEHDASSIAEIASRTNYPVDQVKMMVEKLERERWVTAVKSNVN